MRQRTPMMTSRQIPSKTWENAVFAELELQYAYVTVAQHALAEDATHSAAIVALKDV